ncbi:MAG: alpha/beta hydrolase [Pseudomonadota bacterium]
MNERLDRLIDTAYDLSEDAEHFETFLAEAKAFLFDDLEAGQVARDGKATDQDDPIVDRHTERVQRLIKRSLASQRGQTGRFHAVLELNARSETVQGNPAAARLMNCNFPTRLEGLPLDVEALRFIRKFKEGGEAPAKSDEVILATVEAPEVRSCMALIQRPEDDRGLTRISISYIDWSEALLRRVGGAFGLSDRETKVLSGYLHQQSQSEIAESLGRSLDTIKTQSKTILRKTGCARMSDVVNLAASIAYLLRDMPEAETAPSAEPPWITPTVDMRRAQMADGRELAWYRVGEGTRPVLFVHGLIQGPFFTQAFQRLLAREDLYLICPSRPGFGFTDPSRTRENYNATVVADSLALLGQLGVKRCPVLIHQGGSSHGFRIATAMGDACRGLVIADGGVPVHHPDSLRYMDKNSRTMAAANRRSPSILKMMTQLGIAAYKLRGVRAFLKELYASDIDTQMLRDPALFPVLAYGAFHASEHGAETWVRDGNAAMQDWEADLTAFTGPQHWLLGTEAPILSYRWIERRLASIDTANVAVLEGAGNTLLHTHTGPILQAVSDLS